MMPTHSEKFMLNVAELFSKETHSDAVISIHGVKLPVHKFVICTQSAYFAKAFQEKYVEGSSGVLEFDEGSGAAHWRVLEYLYTGDYSDNVSNDFEEDPMLLKDPRVYALADMFFLEDLKTLATAKLQQKLQDLWTSDSFPDCIREVYTSTPSSDRMMRSAVVGVTRTHAHILGAKAVFQDLIYEGGDFAVDLFGRIDFSVLQKVSNTSKVGRFAPIK